MLDSFQPIIYVQISPERLRIKDVRTGRTVDEVPEVAIQKTPSVRVVAFGDAARSMGNAGEIDVFNPFAHPRSLVSDFTVAEQLLKLQLRRMRRNRWLSFAPYVVIHPLGSPAGGFTQVERRAFREMGLGAGASIVHVWTGRPLADHEVLSKRPPQSGGEWE